MVQIVGIAGSLRAESFNRKLLAAAAELAPGGATVEPGDISRIPLYNGDLEKQGVPAAVTALKDQIREADGLLLVSPEYNHGIPGVMKNVIDWLSRPPEDIKTVYRNRPVAVMGATPGPGGTRLVQAAWLPPLRALGTRPWFGGRLMVSRAGTVIDAEDGLTDADTRERLAEFLRGFVEFARS